MATVERKRKADTEKQRPLDQRWRDEKENAKQKPGREPRDGARPKRDDRGPQNGPNPPRVRRKELPPVRPPPRGRARMGETRSLVEMRRSSPVDVDHQRTSLTATQNAITCFFHKDDDYTAKPVKIVIHPKKYRKLETVTRDLSDTMKELPFGVRSIFTPRAKHRIHNLEDFTNDGHYICSSNRKFARGLDVARVQPQHVWHNLRPDSGRRVLNRLLHEIELRSAKKRGGSRPGYDLTNVYTRIPPKKLTVMKNGEPDIKHCVLLNRRTAQTFEQVLKTLSELFFFAVRKLYTIEGNVINSLSTMLNGPDYLVAAGQEHFINMSMDYANPSRAQTRLRSQLGSRISIQSRLQSRKDRLAKTKGRWKVTVRTNTLPSAGTQAQVTITVYGHKGNSGAVTLGHGDGYSFQPGNIDEFEIQVGNVGEIYKIRLAHDNSGDFPGWLCDDVSMHDLDTGENLNFSCHRWLARDEDDQEITRELAVKRPGESILPLIKYQVDVFTGDIWGGGTDANIYITIYGDRGDTGVRQLYAETKGVYFKQGQMDSFEVEAVSLGHLKRIIIGHDGTGPGAGWYLDKVIIREPPLRPDHDFVFYCGKWLDEGEDDGKIVRELRVQDEYMDDILEKRNWEWEKWKYEKDCQVMFYSVITGKPLRLNRDLTVDGLGEEKDKIAVFNVNPKKPMKPVFSSAANSHSYLAIDNGRITGMGKGGPYCEFRIRVQHDRTTLLESVKNPLQFVTIGPDGSPGEVRGILDKEPTRRFYVYAKGCFRHKGIIMLCTSTLQCINVDRLDKTLTGRGRRSGPASQFKVHKVSAGGIRMFESVANPGSYIRLKDGKIDCAGLRDSDSHFLVLRHKDKGYITLQSATQRGLYIGMTADGRVHTTIDTGVRNIWLYPEVVEWGIPKSKSVEMIEEETMQNLREDMTPVSVPPVPPTPKSEKQFAEGDWGIKVTTIEQLVNADVALVCYGDLGNSGPIILGAPPGKLIFQDGNEDEFRANLLKIGKLYKIRLELMAKTSTKEPSWKVKEVKMQDLNTKTSLKFMFNRWLSTSEDDWDIMRELPAVRPGEDILPVYKYVVSVYTGKEIGADTDADVYLNVHGDRGDWGKRYLRKSNNTRKYRTGQVDVFYIEAVSLGHLQRCIVGHDSTGAGEGWYLEQITVRESETSTEEYVFPCNRWLDTSMEDRKLERTLMVKEPAPTKVRRDETRKLDVKSTGEYEVLTMTNEDSKPPNGGRVFIVVYGSKKKSEEIKLYAPDPNNKTFEPGNIDKFKISVGDLGDLYKIRVGRDDSDQWAGWHLGEVKIVDSTTKEEMVFNFNRWLSRETDDGDMVRELPVMLPGKDTLQVYHYQVQVYTGDHWGAGTDANMFITINGTRGDSGRRLLYKCLNNRVKFKRGQMDTFELEAVDLGELDSVVISHDGRGHGAGIFLDKIVIKERDSNKSHLQYVFPCGRWLDSHQDDCLTQRTLRMLDLIDSTVAAPQKEANRKSEGNYEVTVKTSAGDNTATTAHTFITLYGSSGHSAVPLKLQDQATDLYTAGAETKFQIAASSVGKLSKIRLEHDNTGSKPDWKVDYVKLLDMDTNEETIFYLDRWISVNQDDHQICREMPVVRKGAATLPVHKYVVAITTGSFKNSGSEGGQVSVSLIGVNGDTGTRRLTAPITKHRLPWQPGQEDIFVIEAVSVGKLKNVEVNFSSPKQGDRWYLQQIRVSEDVRAVSQCLIYCHQWISDSMTFPVSDIQPSTSLLEALESIPRGLDRPVKTKGRWMVWVQTGTQSDSGTTEKVCLVLCGVKGESEPVHVNAKDDLNPGSFIRLEAKVSDIGLLFKVRVYFPDQHHGSSWFLSKMKLKDQDTGEELHFDHNDWIESTNENPEGAAELPVVRPDLHPITEQIYIVSVNTGQLPRSETDANVFCNLIGQWGSTGRRSLAESGNKDMFREGQVDQFTLTCMDLGKVEKVIIGHDSAGRGQGWFCESVTIKVAEEDETVFPCNRWLDTGCDDRKLSKELYPLSRYPMNYEPPTKYLRMSDGIWNFHITTAGPDKLSKIDNRSSQKSGEVSIVVYGSKATKGPIELTSEDRHVLLPGKVDLFEDYELGDIGEIEKIRVSSGYEGDVEAVWTIQEVVLEDQKSGELLKFDYSGWVGEVGGDIRKELPYVAPGKDYRQVVKYFIEVHTSEAEMTAGTNANVFITLYGSQSDSGRRHLIHNKEARKRFQAGQIDKFELEAVHLGDLEKVVVAKGPGKPWLLEKIVVKEGEFAAEEHVFLFEGWVGDKQREKEEIEETLKLTATIPSHVAINILDAPELELSQGHWMIEALTGGRRGPEEPFDAVVVFCGMKGESQPVPLQSSRDNPFQIGQTDTFNVKYSEDVGELRKIRLGFVDTSTEKGWYVRKVQFEDVDSKDMFWTDLNGWVAVDNKLDGWKEFPIPWPAIHVPKVFTYVVTVRVGDVGPDWVDSDVYIIMYGEQGQTGRRLLKHSLSHATKIKQNQTDVFEVEAVDLGDFLKIVIGHDRTGKGEGWFLERVMIQESPEEKELLFECNRWFDTGEDDGKIERTLFPIHMSGGHIPEDQNTNADVIVPLISPKLSREPTPVSELLGEEKEEPKIEETEDVAKNPTPVPAADGHKFIVTTTTGGDHGEGTGSTVVLVLYGEKGHSQPLVLGDWEDRGFISGSTDTFSLNLPEDLGELFKVRIGFLSDNEVSWYEDYSQAPSWFIEKFTVEDTNTSTVYEFEAGVWVKMDAYNDFWRELPVIKANLPVYQYKVTVYTGEDSKAGTDANVFIQIFGQCGDTGYRKLMASKTNANKFERGNKDIFEIGAVDMGKLSKVKIRHDGSGPGSGWQLDRIVIQETEETTIRYVFRYERWLDESDGENGIEQELILSDIMVADEDDQKEDLPGHPWQIVALTGEDQAEGTDSAVELILYGDKGQSQPLVLGEREDFRFSRGATDTFNVRIMEEIGTLYKVRVGFYDDGVTDWFQNFSQGPTWFIEQLNLTDGTSQEQYELGPAWVRVTSSEDYWRELPVINKGEKLQVYQYQVEVYTGDESKAGTDANVSLQLYGQRGDTGLRKLMASKTNANKFEQGQCDVFDLNAVDLDDLVKVKVVHDGAGVGSGWYLDKIVVKATADADTRYVFNCGKWLDDRGESEMVEQEFILSDVLHGKQEEEENIVGNPWTVWTVTGSEGEAGTDNPVDLILYGDRGHSQPVVIGGAENFSFSKGQVDVFEIRVLEDIGELYKVRVGFHGDRGEVVWYQNYSLAPSWFLESLKLKDETSGREYEMEAGVTLQVEKYSDFWRELTLKADNKLTVFTYQVEVYTGDEFQSGTDTTVTLQLFGERGDTGPRRLMNSKTNADKFESGGKDLFEIPAVDLGKLVKVRVTHDGAGVGSAWMLDKVIVKESEDAKLQYVFNCGKWLDLAGGTLIAEETLALSEVQEVPDVEDERVDSPPGKAGEWKVLVTTSEDADSGTDSNVTLTVYGDADNSGPITLGSANTGYFYSGHTDEFDIFLDTEELGLIRKIRLEHDNSGRPWKVDKVVLRNRQDKSKIEFPINRKLCLETKGTDIAVEIPVKAHDWPVRNYVVETLTGEGFESEADTMVYINLVGTLGDSGKRFLVHNMEENEKKFQTGQTDTFIVEAVDLGRLQQVYIGHNGKGPGSGWFLKQVVVRESMEAEEKYVFRCERWLHEDKDDGLTERVLSVEMVSKNGEPDQEIENEMGDQELQQEYQDQEDPELPRSPENNVKHEEDKSNETYTEGEKEEQEIPDEKQEEENNISEKNTESALEINDSKIENNKEETKDILENSGSHKDTTETVNTPADSEKQNVDEAKSPEAAKDEIADDKTEPDKDAEQTTDDKLAEHDKDIKETDKQAESEKDTEQTDDDQAEPDKNIEETDDKQVEPAKDTGETDKQAEADKDTEQTMDEQAEADKDTEQTMDEQAEPDNDTEQTDDNQAEPDKDTEQTDDEPDKDTEQTGDEQDKDIEDSKHATEH